jgi:hypothetical protein
LFLNDFLNFLSQTLIMVMIIILNIAFHNTLQAK